ncbi:carboxymuconolactone decarboxylase family protein [Peribacillus frigoritolerans]|uniref:carboxymuconolactone decarboxylase family protein n=1 Tax=Peribacillus frigoritolerans TaxID=450367 RepID=UPI001EFDB62E|nr:carboxymuconolactone decarboxylase family protein [Peribacillus frigoritolerans]MED3708675.1 carboxymuconolactone decarboxylase family protein [Peribacillus frigoritolerans]ULM95081.1 carboxymuconolactone decarboxylase family protein [Peribacillus frigoritolerans]
MDRVEKSQEKFKQLFGEGITAAHATDPDFQDILNHFIFGEVFYQGNLDDKMRELITLVVLATNQTLPQLNAHVHAALNVGLTSVEIKEAVYQCAPYIGFPKTLNAINEVNEVFKAKNITLPIESQKTVDEENRFDKGLAVQVKIFGDVIKKMQESAPSNQKHIQEYLSTFCFGDLYTRGGLDLKTRELLTLCIITALGGAEGQVKAHVQGNKNVGNDKETLIAAITHCLPYMGFPRTLNALACVNEIIPEN